MTRIGLVLVLVLALAACGGDERGAVPAPAARSHASAATVLGLVWNAQLGELRRLDARTLRPVGRAQVTGLRPGTPAFSPDRRTLVLGSAERPPRLRFFDVRRMRPLGTRLDLPGAGWVREVSWVSADRLAVLVDGDEPSIVTVDPSTPRVLHAERLAGVVMAVESRAARLVALLAPSASIGPARLAVADAVLGSVRTVALPGIAAGSERIEDPNDAYASRTESPGVAISPDGRRALIVPAGRRVAEVDLDSLRVSLHELSEPVSVLGRLRGWLEPAAHAKVVVGPSRTALWVGAHHVLVTGMDQHGIVDDEWDADAAGLLSIDTRDWRVRTLAEHVSSIARAGDLVLAFGGSWPEGSQGVGLRALGPNGDERFHALGDLRIGWVETALPYAYVARAGEQTARRDVVDLRSGRVLGRTSPGRPVTIVGR